MKRVQSRLMNSLARCINRFPHLRVGQIVDSAFFALHGPEYKNKGLFYASDDEFIKGLELLLKNGMPQG